MKASFCRSFIDVGNVLNQTCVQTTVKNPAPNSDPTLIVRTTAKARTEKPFGLDSRLAGVAMKLHLAYSATNRLTTVEMPLTGLIT